MSVAYIDSRKSSGGTGSASSPWANISYANAALAVSSHGITELKIYAPPSNPLYADSYLKLTATVDGLKITSALTGEKAKIGFEESLATKTWTKTAGRTNVYQTVLTQGEYRTIGELLMPGDFHSFAWYEPLSTIDAVDSTSGSYKLDESTPGGGSATIYVNVLSSTKNPSGQALTSRPNWLTPNGNRSGCIVFSNCKNVEISFLDLHDPSLVNSSTLMADAASQWILGCDVNDGIGGSNYFHDLTLRGGGQHCIGQVNTIASSKCEFRRINYGYSHLTAGTGVWVWNTTTSGTEVDIADIVCEYGLAEYRTGAGKTATFDFLHHANGGTFSKFSIKNASFTSKVQFGDDPGCDIDISNAKFVDFTNNVSAITHAVHFTDCRLTGGMATNVQGGEYVFRSSYMAPYANASFPVALKSIYDIDYCTIDFIAGGANAGSNLIGHFTSAGGLALKACEFSMKRSTVLSAVEGHAGGCPLFYQMRADELVTLDDNLYAVTDGWDSGRSAWVNLVTQFDSNNDGTSNGPITWQQAGYNAASAKVSWHGSASAPANTGYAAVGINTDATWIEIALAANATAAIKDTDATDLSGNTFATRSARSCYESASSAAVDVPSEDYIAGQAAQLIDDKTAVLAKADRVVAGTRIPEIGIGEPFGTVKAVQPPVSNRTVVAQAYADNGFGTIQADKEMLIKLTKPPTDDGYAYDYTERSVVADDDGLFSFDVLKGADYLTKRNGREKRQHIPIDATSPYTLDEV